MTTAIFGSLTIKTATNPIHNINFPKINIEKPKEEQSTKGNQEDLIEVSTKEMTDSINAAKSYFGSLTGIKEGYYVIPEKVTSTIDYAEDEEEKIFDQQFDGITYKELEEFNKSLEEV